MCRLLGLLSAPRTSAFAPLADTDKSLWRQSFADPRQRQRDGWGLAWWDGAARPRLFKSAGPLPREKGKLERAASGARGRTVLFHLRRASNPRGLPASRLRGIRNSQPFSDGRWAFVHNGSIPFADETARSLGPWRRRIRGENDSEVLFWLLRREMARRGSVPAALRAARRSVGRHRGLNILLSDGGRLWAYAEAPAGMKKGASALCTPGWPYFQLAFLPLEDRLWVASEPLWGGAPWRPVRSRELLEARRAGDRVIWTKTRIENVPSPL